jgi:hypothetical protein
LCCNFGQVHASPSQFLLVHGFIMSRHTRSPQWEAAKLWVDVRAVMSFQRVRETESTMETVTSSMDHSGPGGKRYYPVARRPMPSA